MSGQWKNFDFTANFTYMLGFDVLNSTAYDLSSANGSSQTNPKNVLAKFGYDSRWVYHGDIYNTNADGSTSLYNKENLLSVIASILNIWMYTSGLILVRLFGIRMT